MKAPEIQRMTEFDDKDCRAQQGSKSVLAAAV
jgi:hypothetical protein